MWLHYTSTHGFLNPLNFELHAVQHDWSKACLAALHMYLLNPPNWYLKSAINNLKIFQRATRVDDQQKLREQLSSNTDDEEVYSFCIEFLLSKILVCDNYEKQDGTTLKNVYVEYHLQPKP